MTDGGAFHAWHEDFKRSLGKREKKALRKKLKKLKLRIIIRWEARWTCY